MASHAFSHFEVEALRANILADAPDTPVPASAVFNAFASAHDADSLSISTSEGRRGAKGAMMAIGIEAAAAFSIYGVYLLWHVIR
jgi:hypothetical protein